MSCNVHTVALKLKELMPTSYSLISRKQRANQAYYSSAHLSISSITLAQTTEPTMPKMNAAPMLTNPAQGGTMFGKRHKTAQELAACAHPLSFRYNTVTCACAGQASHEKTQAQDYPVQQVCFGAGTLCRTAVNLRGLLPREALFFLHSSVFFVFCFNQVNRSKPKKQKN